VSNRYKLILASDRGNIISFNDFNDKDNEKLTYFETGVIFHIRGMVESGMFGNYANCCVSRIVSNDSTIYAIVAQNPHSTAPEYHTLVTITATIKNVSNTMKYANTFNGRENYNVKEVAEYLCNLEL
jgi:hypothetical protein